MKKIYYLMMILTVNLLFSCSEEFDNPIQHEHYHSMMHRVNYEEMLNFIGNQEIDDLNSHLIKEEHYVNYIDYNRITKIVYNNIVTFTMYIKTKDDEFYKFSNLVINLSSINIFV